MNKATTPLAIAAIGLASVCLYQARLLHLE